MTMDWKNTYEHYREMALIYNKIRLIRNFEYIVYDKVFLRT